MLNDKIKKITLIEKKQINYTNKIKKSFFLIVNYNNKAHMF